MSPAPGAPVHLAVALEGAGWHPVAWREPAARPAELFDARYWADLVNEAEQGLVDFVTIEDSLGLQSSSRKGPDERTDQVRGRLDAVLIAARVAPVTRHVGLVPTVVVTHTEPFHAAKAIATLDFVSHGRAGVRVQVAAQPYLAEHFGRRRLPDPGGPPEDHAGLVGELFDEARDYVEVLRRLWDSWEDDAEIRDASTGRFVDIDRLHYIDFEGAQFSVRGPSITPRPPQGQPLVAALAHQQVPYELVATSADVGFVTPVDETSAEAIVATVRSAQAAAGRPDDEVRVMADLVVFLDQDAKVAEARRARLDELFGHEYRSDALVFTGSPSGLADLLVRWQAAGLAGFRLRPGTIPHDLEAITRGLVPELQRRGVYPERYDTGTLRARLGFERPANRYATARTGAPS